MPSVKLWVDAAKSVALMVGFKKKKKFINLTIIQYVMIQFVPV